jgi:hypothetical protein
MAQKVFVVVLSFDNSDRDPVAFRVPLPHCVGVVDENIVGG